jgi:SP family xylose:H+ symportor-like MFS transporter
LGTAISALFAGGLCKYGKLKMIKMASLLMIVGVVMTLFDFNLWFLAGARFIYGLAIGALTVFVPKFINETTPTELKGPYGGISQIMCCIGILVPSLLALVIPKSSDPDFSSSDFLVKEYWRICWGVPIVIALLQLSLI